MSIQKKNKSSHNIKILLYLILRLSINLKIFKSKFPVLHKMNNSIPKINNDAIIKNITITINVLGNIYSLLEYTLIPLYLLNVYSISNIFAGSFSSIALITTNLPSLFLEYSANEINHDLEIIITIIPTNNNAIPVSSKLFNAIDAVTREISVIHSDLNFSLITFRRSIKFSDVCIINSYCFNNIS